MEVHHWQRPISHSNCKRRSDAQREAILEEPREGIGGVSRSPQRLTTLTVLTTLTGWWPGW